MNMRCRAASKGTEEPMNRAERNTWLIAAAVLLAAGTVAAQRSPGRDALVVEQQTVLERFREAEKRLLEMADQLRATDPARAEQFTKAVSIAREKFVIDNMARIAELLRRERYAEAMDLQEQTLAGLSELLAALASQEWRAEMARLGQLRRVLDGLIQRQQMASAELAAAGRDLSDALREQEEVLSDTETLKGELEGAGAEGAGRAAGSVRVASRAMRAAADMLGAGTRRGVATQQREAERALAAARQQIDEAIREVKARRQQEMLSRLIEMLEGMLSAQQAVSRETAAAHERRSGLGPLPRDEWLLIRGLAVRERRIIDMAQAAEALLREDGTSVVLPGALESLREDLEQAAALIDDMQIGAATQALQADIERTLAGLVEAFRLERKERAKDPGRPVSEAEERRDGQPPLVPALAELKIMRTLQQNLNLATERLEATRGDDGGLPPEAAGALKKLQRRQGELRTMALELGRRSRRH